MSNMTKRQLAFESADCSPVPRHDLVVFRKRDTGYQLYRVILDGERFKLPILKKVSDFISYAVSRQAGLSHHFQRKCISKDQLHAFTLHCTLVIRVADPGTLAEELVVRNGDPLFYVEEGAARILLETVRRLDWTLIEEESRELERFTLLEENPDEDGVMRTNLDLIQRFAERYGIEVMTVSIRRSLPTAELEDRKAAIDDRRRALAIQRAGEIGFLAAENRGVDEFIARSYDSSLSLDKIQTLEDKLSRVPATARLPAAGGRKVTVNLPEEAFQHRPWSPLAVAQEMRLLWLLEEVRARRLGFGKASELAEVPVASFLRLMGEHHITPFDYDESELERELGKTS